MHEKTTQKKSYFMHVVLCCVNSKIPIKYFLTVLQSNTKILTSHKTFKFYV